MALYYDLPVYRDTYKLILKIFEVSKDFPKEYKYTLTRSQAPAWECRPGSSSFQSHEAGASASRFPSWSLGTRRTLTVFSLLRVLRVFVVNAFLFYSFPSSSLGTRRALTVFAFLRVLRVFVVNAFSGSH